MTHHNHQNFAAAAGLQPVVSAAQGDSPRQFSASRDDALTARSVKRAVSCGNSLTQLADSQSAAAPAATTCRASDPKDGKAKTGRKSRAKTDGGAAGRWLESARFDWFQGVLPNRDGGGTCIVGGAEERMAIRDAHKFLFGLGLRAGKQGTGGRGYATGLPFMVGRTGTAQVASITSGSRTGGMPNLCLTGGDGLCAEAAPLVQQRWTMFRPTRIDVCIDIRGKDAEGAWDRLFEMTRAFADKRKIGGLDTRGIETPETGRTFYLGGDRADVFLRVYEKGKQMKGVKGVLDAPDDWLRIEFVFRNIDGDLKAEFGQLSPGDMIRTKIWPRKWIGEAVRAVGASVRAEHVAAIALRKDKRAADARATVAHGVYQYAGAIAKVAHDEILNIRAPAIKEATAAVVAAKEAVKDAVDPAEAKEALAAKESALSDLRQVSRGRLERQMGVVVLREIRAQGDRLDRIIERDGLCIDDTPEDMAMRAAERMQQARVENLRVEMAAQRTVAEAVGYGTPEDIAKVVASFEATQERYAEAVNAPRREQEYLAGRRKDKRRKMRQEYFRAKAMVKGKRKKRRAT